MGFDLGSFVRDAAATAGKAVEGAALGPAGAIIAATGVADKPIGDVMQAVRGVPVVGQWYAGSLDMYAKPFQISADILQGKAIDRIAVDRWNQTVQDAREQAPLAQSVISFVPGVGPGVSAAIGAGLALAQGEDLSDAALAGIKSALPGGPIAAAAFDLGKAAMQGKFSSGVGAAGALVGALGDAAGVQVPPAAGKLLEVGLQTAQSVASGQGLPLALLNSAMGALPADVKSQATALIGGNNSQVIDFFVSQGEKMIPTGASAREALHKALQIGVAAQHGQNLQRSLRGAIVKPANLARLAALGRQLEATDHVIAEARKTLKSKGERGFDIGVGLTRHRTTPFEIKTTRGELKIADDKHGFDVATALHVGRVAGPKLSAAHPAVRAGHAITHGAIHHPEHKPLVSEVAGSGDKPAQGATIATLQIARARQTDWKALLVDAGLVAGGALLGGGLAWPVGAGVGALLGGAADLARRHWRLF